MACNFDSTANVDDGLCEYESCLDCAGELFGEATLDSCGLCAGGNTGIGPSDQCWAIIDDIVDVPNDQGGRVYLHFTPSSLDTDSLTQRNELYSVERLDPIEGGTDSVWVNVASGPAYGLGEYVFEVTTLVDSNDFQPGITAFRVLASMDEGTWASDIAYGYSTDDIAPLPPTGLIALVVDNSIVLTWDHNGVDDFDHYTVYKSIDPEFVINEDNILVHTNDTTFTDVDIAENTIYYYMVTSTDYNGNVSDPSNQAEGTIYVNYAPTIETIDDLTTDEDTPIAIDLQVSDVNGDSLTFEITSSDENVIPQLDGLTLNLDLVENWNGSSDISITVSDSEFDVTEGFTLDVTPVNDAPQSFSTLGPETGTVIALTPDNLTELLLFSWDQSVDVDGDEILYSLVGMGELQIIAEDSITAEEISIPFSVIAETMQQNQLISISGSWKITATDQEYSVESDDSPELTIDASQLGVDPIGIPQEYALHQNYPNPFNPVTTLRFDLPEKSHVIITVYDLMGKKINTLINEQMNPGYKAIQWNATNDFGQPVSAGMYLYMIQAGDFRQTRKMVLLK
ncbi:MAG TPA: T9SS type A sorting domain-containing protein [Gemmatimonadetes bacterium]|nr:T9SS type A sorting domain-containing protein [Gemmatimonadota bacterium]